MRAVFWVILTLVLAVATHLFYTLFLPSNRLSETLETALKNQGDNKFSILDSVLQQQILSFASSTDLVGMCKFDLTRAPVRMKMIAPDGYWTFMVFTMRGRQVYALNNEQAGAREFSVKLSRSQSLISQLTDGSEEYKNIRPDDLVWNVRTQPQGLAVFWMPQSDPLLRHAASMELARSSCEPEPE